MQLQNFGYRRVHKCIKKVHPTCIYGPYKPFTKTVLWLVKLTGSYYCTTIVLLLCMYRNERS